MMKCMAVMMLAAPLVAIANSPFAGSWQIKPEATTFILAPLVFKVDKGSYQRTSCKNPLEVPADGLNHAVRGEALFDAMSVRVVDRDRIEITESRGSKLTWKGLYTVSRDRNSLTLKYSSDRAPVNVTGELHYVRQGDAAAATAHATSGIWQPDRMGALSDAGLRFTYKEIDNGLVMTAGDGRSYEAMFDLQEHPLQGDIDGATVRLGRLPNNTLHVAYRRGGSVSEITRATVSADGNTMTFIDADQNCHGVTTYVLDRISD